MTHFALNSIQHDNYTYLMRLRDYALTRPAEAVLTYGIDLNTADCYSKLNDLDVMSLAYEPDMSVAVPRYDCYQLQQLLSKPVHIRGMYAVALDVATINQKRTRPQNFTK